VSILATALAAGNPPRMGGYTEADLARFMAKVSPEPTSGCWLWTAAITPVTGYGAFGIGGRSRVEAAHRVSWRLFRGPIPAGMQVLHRCDNRACVSPHHLFLGTPADNVADRIAKGRTRLGPPMRGEAAPGAKLTERDVLEIRARGYAGESQRGLAREFRVSRRTIKFVLAREHWAHVPEAL
jgi:hypothetical protein